MRDGAKLPILKVAERASERGVTSPQPRLVCDDKGIQTPVLVHNRDAPWPLQTRADEIQICGKGLHYACFEARKSRELILCKCHTRFFLFLISNSAKWLGRQ